MSSEVKTILYFIFVSIIITFAIVAFNLSLSNSLSSFSLEFSIFLVVVYFSDVAMSIWLIKHTDSVFWRFFVAMISFAVTTPFFFATYYSSEMNSNCIVGAVNNYDSIFFSYSILTGNGYFQYAVGSACSVAVVFESIFGVIYLGLIASILYGWIKNID